ncbi:MAG: FIST C-terminal domain-containing protein [Candidatus Latescibacteria bacterium]|nr:FIST C-terminal domain-containing protein [Candidatus Latescibacterota bacterium]
MKVGIGFDNSQDAFSSGKNVAARAFEDGGLARPDLALAFCHGDIDHDGFFDGLRSVVGPDVPVAGGSAIGIITSDTQCYEGNPSGCLMLESDDLRLDFAVSDGLDRGERQAGLRLAEKLGTDIAPPVFLFYDSIKRPATATSPPVMNASAPLIEGVEEGMSHNVPILGAGLIGDYGFGPVSMFRGDGTGSQCAMAFSLHGPFTTYDRVMHGCTPLDGMYHTITRIDSDIVYELDDEPIERLIDEIYGNEKWRGQRPVDLVCLGINYGEKYGIPKESDYVNRIITGYLPDERGIRLFEPDLSEGMSIQFMLRDTGQIIESAKRNSIELIRDIKANGKKPFLGIYIDCAGRAAAYSNSETEEAAEVRRVFNRNGIPLFGFYSGVEIAPMQGKSRGLDWTGVLVVFAEG